ncbi:hypothetical protein ACFXG4_43425 [Nocardia sp. NPDC059246]
MRSPSRRKDRALTYDVLSADTERERRRIADQAVQLFYDGHTLPAVHN